jgi:hypothetical protein
LWGGHNVIIINGNVRAYFECKKDVRQGTLCLPYLFLLAAEELHKLLSFGITKGHFEGLGPVLSNQQKIMHILYVDDTLLFIRAGPIMNKSNGLC